MYKTLLSFLTKKKRAGQKTFFIAPSPALLIILSYAYFRLSQQFTAPLSQKDLSWISAGASPTAVPESLSVRHEHNMAHRPGRFLEHSHFSIQALNDRHVGINRTIYII